MKVTTKAHCSRIGGFKIQSVILAAGRGERLSPITNTRPKSLIRLCGQSILERLLNTCSQVGINDFIIGLGYRGHQIQEHLKGSKFADNIHFVEVEKYEIGPLQTLTSCLEQVDDAPVLVLPSDLVTAEELLQSFIDAKVNIGSLDAILGVMASGDKSQVHIDDSGTILGIGNDSGDYTQSLSSAMLLLISQNFFSKLQTALDDGCTRVSDALNYWIHRGTKIGSEMVDGFCYDLDNPPTLLQATKFLLESKTVKPNGIHVPKGDVMEIGDAIHLSNGLSLYPGVSLKGPLYIDAGCIIEASCEVGPSVSLDCRTIVKTNSVLSDMISVGNVTLPSNSHIQNAVVYDNQVLRGL
ncbi:MAG: hypothetical protein BAJATHORv1_100067 [Candidatus Thorarchaeota archaeon]|nr:MAG: hypothetical protein BAJATHORv1_100067 [Candidatus Thorarchaeota archaeon]